MLADASADDIEIVVSYLSGGLRQRRTGLGWRSLRHLPPPAAEPTLTVAEVDAAFAAMAELAGPGSGAARAEAVRACSPGPPTGSSGSCAGWSSASSGRARWMPLVQDGLAAAYGVPVAAVRRAAMLLSSTTDGRPAAGARRAAGAGGGRTAGRHRDPAHAGGQSRPTPRPRSPRSGLPAVVDVKLDGIRVQVHRAATTVRIFTRSLDDITARLPEVVTAVRALPQTRLVLDGEVLALRRRRAAGGLPGGGLPDDEQTTRAGPTPDAAAGVLLRPAARRRARPARRAAARSG